MKNYIHKLLIALLLVAIIPLSGCPLQTTNAIDDGSYGETAWMAGTWAEVKSDGSTGSVYLVTNNNELKYQELDSTGKPRSDAYSLKVSDVGGKIFVSAYAPPDDASTGGYYIFKLDKQSSTAFTLTPVRENELSPDISSAALKEYLKKNATNENIYGLSGVTKYVKK